MVKIVKGYGLLIISILLLGFGIYVVTIAGLGTTAISSLPYVLSFIFPLSFGTFTALFNIVYVFIQIILLKQEFPREQYLQIFVGPLLGLSIDLSVFLFAFSSPETYLSQFVMVTIGCAIIAFSIFLQLKADVVNNPGEGIVKAISIKVNKDFGDVKFLTDLGLVVLSIILALLALGEVVGVREGTVISVIIVGPLVKFFRIVFEKMEHLIIRGSRLQD